MTNGSAVIKSSTQLDNIDSSEKFQQPQKKDSKTKPTFKAAGTCVYCDLGAAKLKGLTNVYELGASIGQIRKKRNGWVQCAIFFLIF